MTDDAFAYNTAVRAQKRKRVSDGLPWQDDELFPTPPWATRALTEIVLPRLHVRSLGVVWEPCAGLGHMAEVLKERATRVDATDKNVYPLGLGGDMDIYDVEQLDFLRFDAVSFDQQQDWIITNPPFGQAVAMAQHAMDCARHGVAFLLRIQWLESAERWAMFQQSPPSLVAPFVERVAMCEGGWDPRCSTATGYAWFVWVKDRDGWAKPARAYEGAFDGMLIPPCKKAMTRASDARLAARFVPGFVPPSTLKKAGKAQKALPV
jgi:hypothetical protein